MGMTSCWLGYFFVVVIGWTALFVTDHGLLASRGTALPIGVGALVGVYLHRADEHPAVSNTGIFARFSVLSSVGLCGSWAITSMLVGSIAESARISAFFLAMIGGNVLDGIVDAIDQAMERQ